MSPVDFFWPTIPLKADRCHDEKKPCSAVSQKAFINDLTKREYTIQDFRKRVKKSRDAVTLISIHIRQALTRKLSLCTIFQKIILHFWNCGAKLYEYFDDASDHWSVQIQINITGSGSGWIFIVFDGPESSWIRLIFASSGSGGIRSNFAGSGSYWIRIILPVLDLIGFE